MADYSEFETLVGELKRAAIDASVAELVEVNKPLGYKLEAIEDGRYLISSPDVFRGPLTLSRPGPTGTGGGVWGSVSGELDEQPFLASQLNEGAFHGIREQIDKLIGRYQQLPEPEAIKEVWTTCARAATKLSATATTDNGVVMGAGPIGGYLNSIDQNCSSMSGTTIGDFKGQFVNRLGETIAALAAVSAVCGNAIAAERSLWEAVRARVAIIVHDAREAFDQLVAARMASGDGGIDWEQVFTIAQWVSTGLSALTFECPPASAGFAIIALEFEIGAAAMADDAEPEPEARTLTTYHEVVDALKGALDSLNGEIIYVEDTIRENLSVNYENITGNPTSFDLTLVPLRSDSEVIILEEALVSEIIEVHMPKVAMELTGAARETHSCRPETAITRSSSLGIGQTGPSPSIDCISEMLEQLLIDLAWEVENGAENLKAALTYFAEHEAQVAEELNRLADEVEQGSGREPWNTEFAFYGDQSPTVPDLDNMLGG